MNLQCYYFSGTGNSLSAARTLSRLLESPEPRGIAAALKMGGPPAPGELLVVSPVYMFRLPHIVVRFLKQIPAGFRLHLVAVNAGGVGGCFNQAERIIRGRGTLVGGYTLVTPSNYLPFGEAVQGEEQRALLEEADKQLAAIAARIAGGGRERDPQSSWFERAIWPGAMYALGYKMIPRMADGFRVDDHCTSCGICARLCPVENIELVEGRPTWGAVCEQCLACLNLCPESAIQHGKTSAAQKRYRNPGVKVSQIIAQKSLKPPLS